MTLATQGQVTLKPCPFCGGSEKYPPRAIQPVAAFSIHWVVQCANCDSMSGPDKEQSGAIEAWNMRGNAL